MVFGSDPNIVFLYLNGAMRFLTALFTSYCVYCVSIYLIEKDDSQIHAIDNTKITTELDWKPAYTFEQGIHETIRWYLDNQMWVDQITSGDYQNYYAKMYHEQGRPSGLFISPP